MDPLILRLGLALSIGILIGLERGWRERDAPGGSRTAGIRTFGMAGFFGGALAVVASAFAAPSVFVAGLLGFSAIFALFEYRETQRDNVFSVTSTIAAMSTVVLGGLAVAGDFRVAAAGGAAVACLLASRELLHGLLRKLSWNEIRSTLTLVAMTAIGLPLLPNHPIDPWGGFNPFEVWLLTVLAGAISYIGYIAIRLLGPRGIIAASLLGATVSSMAVTAALGRQVRSGESVFLMIGGACLAGMVSILRVGLLLTLVQPGLVNSIFLPMCVASIVLGAIGAVLSFHTVAAIPESPAQRNPFDVAALLIFAAAFALISTLSAGLVQHFGAHSVLLTSSVAAVADVDIAVLSALRMDDNSIEPLIGNAILLALATNGFSRVGLAAFTGGARYALGLALASLMAFALGAASLLV